MQNFKIVIEYDGTAYQGWQRQNDGTTIQGTIEAALETMIKNPVTVIGSGRTDAGVHALNQVASFRADTRLTSEIFERGLNSLLPPDIVIKDCAAVDDGFHAQYSARSKVYRYRILNRYTPTALFRQYAWHIRKPLDLNAMNKAMAYLEGQHDFSAFEATGSLRSDAVRTVIDANLTEKDADGYVVFSIEADGFLRHMVRNVVGTLVDVGLGKVSPGAFEDILMSKDRKKAGITAPAHGLVLKEVKY
ncbi:MAG: tRNA pseudouridine(38-40) synthase TruA [Deltaproteobacteria bacterium]|nr:tRNA pseudouridine(38-40) synthase TruA [Deltaproteobacteria bacterium]MBW2170789.1 tRNA pseudouridine(38-40) synthase TruA [Deltaproteobacteria bacterium]MBW2259164.1 tRNA pseudouridine(38-40) synthase TruA [Deltaproteobacteria bacterium]